MAARIEEADANLTRVEIGLAKPLGAATSTLLVAWNATDVSSLDLLTPSPRAWAEGEVVVVVAAEVVAGEAVMTAIAEEAEEEGATTETEGTIGRETGGTTGTIAGEIETETEGTTETIAGETGTENGIAEETVLALALLVDEKRGRKKKDIFFLLLIFFAFFPTLFVFADLQRTLAFSSLFFIHRFEKKMTRGPLAIGVTLRCA